MTSAASAERDFFRADLETAWAAVADVPGPQLGDVGAPLAERNATFAARLRAFLSVFQCGKCGRWRQACRCPPPEFVAEVLDDPYPLPEDDFEPWPT